ncbi:HU family DNA-binding protein [Paracoccus jeotgali]|uniref:HU family DNA-binding protein n=1 Tax=Paracoccus jeotgali TaxID=2065379 RepID=UPI0028AE070F|nr:HU family DNA-binding protein [Paracoccus jeotgali]
MSQPSTQPYTPKPLTKAQLVSALAEEMGSDKQTATAALDALQALVARTIQAGGALTLPGIGKIACRDRPERMVRNPQTQELTHRPADRAVKVTIAKALKDAVNS